MLTRTLVLGLILTAACRGSERADAVRPAADFTLANAGFQTPESVLHDPVADVYLVSNINGSPLGKDDNGFISRVSPDGSLLALKWIDGAGSEVTLHAPKGMALKEDSLFVADIDVVRVFDRATGAPLSERAVPGATFLNDMATGPGGTVYVTDSGLRIGDQGFEPSGTDALYRFEPDGRAVALVKLPGAPNGIATGDRLVMVTFGSGEVFVVDSATGQTSGLPKPPAGALDGIVDLGNGQYLISSWDGQAVYRLGPGGQYTTAVDSVEAPADIGYDRGRQRVLIPLFNANRLEARRLGN